MGLPVVLRTPAYLLISSGMLGTRAELVTLGETAFVLAIVTSGGAGASVTGGGGTWTKIREDSDGTRRVIIFRGTGLVGSSGGTSQTIELSFTATTTCRWSWIAASGISTVDPDDAGDSRTYTAASRTTADTVTSLTTANNVLVIMGMASSQTLLGPGMPSGFTRIGTGNTSQVLAYAALASALTAATLPVTFSAVSSALVGGAHSFNGDDPATGRAWPRRNLRSPLVRM